SGIADLWYGPCVLQPGVLTTAHGLQATPWAEAIASTIAPPPPPAHGSAAADPLDARRCAWRRGRGCSRPGPVVTSDNSLPRGDRLRLSWTPTPHCGARAERPVRMRGRGPRKAPRDRRPGRKSPPRAVPGRRLGNRAG